MTVFFVDYGTLDAVDRRDIRLDIILEDTPIQAMRCVLHNVRPAVEHKDENGSWTVEVLNTLHEWIVDKEFEVTVKSKGPPLRVTMKEVQSSKTVAEQLVAHKFAELISVKKKRASKMKK